MDDIFNAQQPNIYPIFSAVSDVSDISTQSSENGPDNDNNNNNSSGLSNVDDDDTHIQQLLTTQISNISSLSEFRRNEIERSVSHFDSMEKRINRLPQFYRADEFLKCLSEFTIENESLKDFRKLIDQKNPNQKFIKYEVIIENQRGATLFGSKLYSKESVLYPLDPPKYQTLTGQNLANLAMYPEPANNWHWSWKQWHVMMINDVDEEGWIYSAIRFGGYHWTGAGKFGNFVRRRIWIRMSERSKVDDDEEATSGESDEDTDAQHDLEKETIFVNPNFVRTRESPAQSINNNHAEPRKSNDLSLADNRRFDKLPTKGDSTKVFDRSHKADKKHSMLSFKEQLKNSFHIKSSSSGDSEGKLTTIDQLPNDDSTMLFSKEAAENDTHLYDEFLESLLSPDETKPEDLSDLEMIKSTYNLIKSQVVDRKKISVILNSFFSFKSQILQFLIDDYLSNLTKSGSWIYKYLNEIHFHDSKITFLSQFMQRLNKNIHILTYESLEKIYSICKEIGTGDSYNSEKS